jgi:hypothetical protein
MVEGVVWMHVWLDQERVARCFPVDGKAEIGYSGRKQGRNKKRGESMKHMSAIAVRALMWMTIILFSLVGIACHNAKPTNPFHHHPESVSIVSVDLDVLEESALLKWTPSSGMGCCSSFAEYRILRRELSSQSADTIAVILNPEQAEYSDTEIELSESYAYRVFVVNREGYVAEGPEMIISFSLPGVDLTDTVADPQTGTIMLMWDEYTGPSFEGYAVWRRRSGQVKEQLEVIDDKSQTTWVDSVALPGVEYSYWVDVRAAGRRLESYPREAILYIEPVVLLRADFSSKTADAELEWSAYTRPRFEAYEIVRRTEGTLPKVVGVRTDVADTTFVDSLLDGNTVYFYHISVRTEWEEEGAKIRISSQEKRGMFYPLVEVVSLPALNSTEEMHSIGLAIDENDQLVIAATLISTGTAKRMQPGVRIVFPGENRFRTYFVQMEGSSFNPARNSPIPIVAHNGMIYFAARIAVDRCMVGAVRYGGEVVWGRIFPVNDYPAGFYLTERGDVALVDRQAFIYFFGPDGMMRIPEEDEDLPELRSSLETDQALPAWHVVMGYGAGSEGLDQLFVLAPDREESHILARTLFSLAGGRWIFGGRGYGFDNGVGPEVGHTLSPVAMAFDPLRTQLVVIDIDGRLQVFDASPEEVADRYITKWGGYGGGEGEFLTEPISAISLAVDSQGRIYVADGADRVQIFSP